MNNKYSFCGILPRILVSLAFPAVIWMSSAQITEAGSATWKAAPVSGDWNDANNWSAGGPPNGVLDTATFNGSRIRNVTFSGNTTVDGIVYGFDASQYTITTSIAGRLFLVGLGITNNAGVSQRLITNATAGQGGFQFNNSASAGTETVYINGGGTAAGQAGGFIEFFDSSTAADGQYVNNGGTTSTAFGGFIQFHGTATAANGFFRNEAGVAGATGGFINFFDNSSGGNATFLCNGGPTSGAGGGYVHFFNSATAGSGVLSAAGGRNGGDGSNIQFQNDSTGGTVQLGISGNSLVDCFNHNTATPITLGSLEGNGSIFLYGSKLIIGGNNLSTTYSGVISDASLGGRLTKVGGGMLTLAGANTYTGVTTVSAGTLLVGRSTGSGTGTGAVQVTAGTLGGDGRISGAATIGNGSGARSFLAPGLGSVGTLTVQNRVTFQADATYNFELDSSAVTADMLTARGVAIGSGALFSFTDLGNGALASGTVFTVINNTAAIAITGTFSNLVDGSTFTVGSNTYQVSYSGGTGNDLTLTVQ